MVDVAVKSEAAWACRAQGRPLADVVLVHSREDLGQSDETNSGGPVLLEQLEDGAPCVLTLRCSPGPPAAAIGRLLVVSEARTMEVYSQTGEYCGTVRGAEDRTVQPDDADRGPFYRKQLILEQPCSACEVKLLSLAGRSSVQVSRVLVELQALQSCPAGGPGPAPGPAPGIDLQRVQSLMEEMGTSLSPGAQNLMDMVQTQQKNQSAALGGFLPLLMGGGAFAALARGAGAPPSAVSTPSDGPPAAHNGGMSDCASSSSSSSSSPDVPMSDVSSTPGGSESGGPVSHAHLAEMMSRLLKGQGVAAAAAERGGPELLPVLQSVCGQVTQLRLEEEQRRSSWRELDPAMERRLDEMERRLKEHLDRRLDALEQKLEQVLQGVLPQLAVPGGGGLSRGHGGALSSEPPQRLTRNRDACCPSLCGE